MIRIFISFLCILCFSKVYSQTGKNKISFSLRYLGAGDITLHSPDNGRPFRASNRSIVPGIDAGFEIPFKNNFFISTGYRWKQRWGVVSTPVSLDETRLGNVHSIYARMIWRKPFLESLWPGRLSFDLSGGVMGNKNINSVNDFGAFAISTTNTGSVTYTGSNAWNRPYKVPNFTASLDGFAGINFNITERLTATAGYGFNYGLHNLNTGAYGLTGSDGLASSGKLTAKGSYVYLSTGLRFKF